MTLVAVKYLPYNIVEENRLFAAAFLLEFNGSVRRKAFVLIFLKKSYLCSPLNGTFV